LILLLLLLLILRVILRILLLLLYRLLDVFLLLQLVPLLFLYLPSLNDIVALEDLSLPELLDSLELLVLWVLQVMGHLI